MQTIKWQFLAVYKDRKITPLTDWDIDYWAGQTDAYDSYPWEAYFYFQSAAETYSIAAMPTFIAFKGGEKVDEVVGANLDKLREMIEKYK